MNIKIYFFNDNLIQAIEAGIYEITITNEELKSTSLYIGESVFVLVRCAAHLYELKKNPSYFGFTEDNINNPNITINFKLIESNNSKVTEEKKKSS